MKYRIMILMMMMKFRGLILCDTVLTAHVGERLRSGAIWTVVCDTGYSGFCPLGSGRGVGTPFQTSRLTLSGVSMESASHCQVIAQ